MPSGSDKGAHHIVLVVEDDVWQRSLARDVLERAGYDVVEAVNADEAIAILEARKDIHIVFTDIEMPGSIDGLKLARAIRDRWPPIELIITSGKHRLEDDQIPARGKFLPKPYDPDTLTAMVGTLAASSL
jgi:CheY-like chemotaxis protein